MAHNIVIRGGQLVDGTGREPFPGPFRACP